MIALDTNVLVRLFTCDDAAQAEKARKLFDAHANEDGALWIADFVLAELVWALGRTYGHSRSEIAGALRALADNATVRLEGEPFVAEALKLYEAGPADFTDCLLVAKARGVGCGSIATFDRKMRGLPAVKLL
jgi:predicted nucleic-acid-binding protein